MITRTLSIVLVISAGLISGCASTDPAEAAAKRRMPILKAGQEGGRAYAVIQEVKGTACFKGQNIEESSAFTTMKDKAYSIGADAVLNYECRSAGLGKDLLCADLGRAVQCTGDAVRWK